MHEGQGDVMHCVSRGDHRARSCGNPHLSRGLLNLAFRSSNDISPPKEAVFGREGNDQRRESEGARCERGDATRKEGRRVAQDVLLPWGLMPVDAPADGAGGAGAGAGLAVAAAGAAAAVPMMPVRLCTESGGMGCMEEGCGT